MKESVSIVISAISKKWDQGSYLLQFWYSFLMSCQRSDELGVLVAQQFRFGVIRLDIWLQHFNPLANEFQLQHSQCTVSSTNSKAFFVCSGQTKCPVLNGSGQFEKPNLCRYIFTHFASTLTQYSTLNATPCICREGKIKQFLQF